METRIEIADRLLAQARRGAVALETQLSVYAQREDAAVHDADRDFGRFAALRVPKARVAV